MQKSPPLDLVPALMAKINRRSVKTNDGCIILPKGECHIVALGQCYCAQRVAWIAAHGKLPPADRNVLRTCENRKCVNPEHLTLGDPNCNFLPGKPYQNQRNNRNTKLSDEQVRDIRSTPKSKTTQSLAKEYGVSEHCISAARSGASYKWVK